MLASVLDSYLLSRELKLSSERWYREVARLFAQWAGESELTAANVSSFLARQQSAGRSADYRKSLRNGLVALLRFQGDSGKVRPVKLTALHHTAWTKTEISALLRGVDVVIAGEADQRYWRTLIEAAYWSGLSQCDLHNLNRGEVAPDGTVRGERAKTGKPFLTYIPPELVRAAAGRVKPRHGHDPRAARPAGSSRTASRLACTCAPRTAG